jgi:hypothetical protein
VEPTARKPNGCYADMVLQIETPLRTYKLWPKYNDDLVSWQAAISHPPSSLAPRTAASQPEAADARKKLVEQKLGHLYSTPMKLERLSQCGRRLGVCEEEEPHLMWLVHEMQRATAAEAPLLPGDWRAYNDDESGQLYYHNEGIQFTCFTSKQVKKY